MSDASSASRRAEAIRIVRERSGDGMPEMPDEAVAKLAQTQWVEFGLARRELYRAVRDALPGPIRRRFR